MNFQSIRLFTGFDKLKLIVGLILAKIANKLQVFNELRNQKIDLDTIFAEDFKLYLEGEEIKVLKRNLCLFLRLKTSDIKVFKQVFLEKEYEPLIKLISEYRATDDIKVIVDAGANIGLTSIYFHHEFPTASYFIIEPFLDNFEHLKKNVALNFKIDQSVLIQKAVWNKNEDLILTEDFRDGKEWSKSFIPNTEKETTVNVQGFSIHELFLEHNISVIDILKMDIEGAEERFFKDEKINVILSKTRFIAIEIHSEKCSEEDVIGLLNENHFALLKAGETLFGINQKFYSMVRSFSSIY